MPKKMLMPTTPSSPSSSSSSFSSWEDLIVFPSSSSEDKVDDADADWIFLKPNNKKPTTVDEHEPEAKVDEEEDDDNDGDYEMEEEERDSTVFMQELIHVYLPEAAANEKVTLSYIEQELFPRLPANLLLRRLKYGSARWARWISSPFFTHLQSLLHRSLSGFFYHSPSGLPCFVPLSSYPCPLKPDQLSFLPEPVTVKSSSLGILACLGKETLTYYICNPTTAEWAALPPPGNAPHAAAVLVFPQPHALNFEANYRLACAFEVLDGVYSYETFSSEAWAWGTSNEVTAVETVVPASGVSAGGVAYWRTTMGTVVGYAPEDDSWTEVALPGIGEGEWMWEIGEIGGRLGCVRAHRYGQVESLVLGEGGWVEARKLAWDWKDDAVPLRAEGEREVAIWDGTRRTVVVRDVEIGLERALEGGAPGYCADFLPFISTLLHVKRSQ